MTRWFTSDIHFSHANVIEYCDRPYKSIQEMDEAIIKQWNSQVKPEDEVYFLGDFGINVKTAIDSNLVKSLNGKKHIVMGNHDIGFKEGFSGKFNKQYLEVGWESVTSLNSLYLKNGKNVLMTHLPPDNEHDNRYAGFKIKNDPNQIYLHGHLHGHYRKKKNMIDVCFDAELKLLSEDDIISLIEDERDLIPTRLTEKYKNNNLFLMPFEAEVKKGYITKKVKDNLVLFDYTDKCTYDRAWNDVTIWARGIVFNRNTGELVAAPFPKFWNYEELQNPQNTSDPENEMSKAKVKLFNNIKNNVNYQVFNKEDGSLGIIYHDGNEWQVNTRGSFESVQSVKAKEMLKKYDLTDLDKDITLLCEIIYPENKIVVDYKGEEKLVLLAANNRKSLIEVPRFQLEQICNQIKIPLVEQFSYTIEQMMELKKTLPKDNEGFIIRFDDGLRVKIKGEEYLRIHKLISQVTPLAFFESMEDGKVRADFLKELPEEYRKEADEIVKKLEDNYMNVKHQAIYEFANAYPSVYELEDRDKSIRKQIGLNMKLYKHSGAFFAILDQNKKSFDNYIMKIIRPKGNVL